MSATCPKTKELLKRLGEQEVASEADGDTMQHIASCPICQRALEKIGRLESDLQRHYDGIKASFPSVDFNPSKVEDSKTMSERAGFPGGLSMPRFALALGVGIIILVLGGVILHTRRTPASPGKQLASASEVKEGTGFVVSGEISFGDGSAVKMGNSFPISKNPVIVQNSARVRLAHGTEIVFTNARIHFNPQGITLESGKAEILIRKKGTVFSAVTPTAVMGVRGTHFSVNVLPDGANDVFVAEGKVHVSTNSGAECLLEPGRKLHINPDGRFATPPTGFEISRPGAPHLATGPAVRPTDFVLGD